MFKLKLSALLATILFMIFLTYLLMWNPYSLYFDRPENSSTPYQRREIFAGLSAIINFIVLLVATVFSIIKFRRQKAFFIWTPFIGLITLFILLSMNKNYPDSHFEYTKDGYQYLEQRWYLDEKDKFKRFKSKNPLSNYSDYKTINWQLDSANTK